MSASSETLEPRIGRWWAFCCEHDLAEITTLEDVAEVLSTRQYHNSRVWETKEEALRELLSEVEIA